MNNFFESDFCHEAKSAILKISFLFIFDFFQSSFLSLGCFLPNNGFIWVKHDIVGDLVWPQRFWTQFTPHSVPSLNEHTAKLILNGNPKGNPILHIFFDVKNTTKNMCSFYLCFIYARKKFDFFRLFLSEQIILLVFYMCAKKHSEKH